MDNKKKSVIVILALALLSIPLDKYIVQEVISWRIDWLNPVFQWIVLLGTVYFVLFIITTLFLIQENKRKWIFPLWYGMFLTVVAVVILKYIFMVPRPHLVMDIVALEKAFSPSFPSLHAAIVFSAVPLLIKEFRKISVFWIVFAVLVCFGRLYSGVHYLSDVLIGALIGWLIGNYCIRERKNIENKWKKFKKWLGIK